MRRIVPKFRRYRAIFQDRMFGNRHPVTVEFHLDSARALLINAINRRPAFSDAADAPVTREELLVVRMHFIVPIAPCHQVEVPQRLPQTQVRRVSIPFSFRVLLFQWAITQIYTLLCAYASVCRVCSCEVVKKKNADEKMHGIFLVRRFRIGLFKSQLHRSMC